MAGIEIRGVSKVFHANSAARTKPANGAAALHNLDLDVPDGQLLVLVGPSGSGKTTTLRLVAGLVEPSAGSIRLGGRDLRGVPPRQRDMAMVFQQHGLYGHLSARRNMAFGLELRQAGNWFAWLGRRFTTSTVQRQIDQQVVEAARLLGIEPLLDRTVGGLSGGERQRVALGRAIVRQPAAWLMDEPLASLDAPARLTMRQELKQLQRRLRVTTIYVTHDQAEALALADRIAVLDRGQLQQLGTPREIYETPKNLFVAGFFGSQGINLLAGRLQETSGEIQFVHDGLSLAIPPDMQQRLRERLGEPVIAAVRPEDVKLLASSELAGGASFPATVESVDDLGEMRIIHLKLNQQTVDGQKLLSRCDRHPNFVSGETVRVRYERIHWFDASTSLNLTNN